MQEVLGKPLEPAAFAAAISKALRQRQRRSGPGSTQVVAVVDQAVYAKLCRTVGTTLGREILSEFLAGLDGRFVELAAASEARDRARLVFAAHASASVMATFGALALGTALRQLENTARDVSWASIDAQLAAIMQLRVESEAVLRELVDGASEAPASQQKTAVVRKPRE